MTKPKGENWKQINYYEIEENETLGNHYHKKITETFVILEGMAILNGQLLLQGEHIVIKPGTKHTLKTKTKCKILTILSKPFSQEKPDIHV